MALVKYGGGITGISGSIGGQTHARNRFGNYIRQRTKPVNPNTALQQAVRNAIIGLTGRWSSTLTAPQRGQWNAYAQAIAWQNKLGETVKLTGFNMYIRSNAAIDAAGGVTVDDGPAILSLPDGDPVFEIAISEATQLVSVTFDDTLEWLDEDGGWMLVSVGTPVNVTRNFFDGPWRIAGAIEGDSTTPPTTPATLPAPFAYQENQLVYGKARIIREDGRVSQFFRDSVSVAA